ncbi:sulfatase-like hydrolase/transferase [Candidatus Uabimicrobium amorphum]|uniref:Iduronate-2-sulfatase n=1 Tax=Uabimicrobium amorphum TaxID=2596890 RepID=A0A5S9IUB5_UABAM|nr:sulfatase-like hydrolase/transferase [Candidatus Uabimicrobium amorphum]BBM88259.1 iduronate-2-sulfatase [Candidatus Uabimicrobium amorphum]
MKKFTFVVVLLLTIAVIRWQFMPTQATSYNLLLISVDTLRADRLGCYGYETAQTENIDRLASESVVFEKCFAQAPLTFPSHVSIMTGTNPTTHNIKDNLYYKLDEKNLPTMASILQAYGYQTAAVVSAAPLNKSKGLNKGFDWYSDVEDITVEEDSKFIAERTAEHSVKIANDYLEKMTQKSDPFFLWLHLFDPHAEYKAPQRFAESFIHPYDAEIAYTDYCLGLLFDKLKKLGKYDNTIIVFVSDHGEGLGEHGELSHGYYIYNSTVHVPLMFKVPSAVKKRYTFPVRTIDILPTVMALLDKSELTDYHQSTREQQSEGYDLSPYFTSSSKENMQPPPLRCYSEAYYVYHVFGWSIMTSVVEGDYKYIGTKEGELYNIVHDMHEKNNLVEEKKYTGLVKKMRKTLTKMRKNTGVSQTLNVDDPNAAALSAIGYLQGHKPKIAPTSGPDPVEMQDIIKLITNAQTQMFLRRYTQCEKILKIIVDKDPKNIMAWMLFGKLYTQMGQFAKSLQAFTKMEELCKTSRFARSGRIDALIQLQHLDKALNLIEKTFTEETGAERDAFLHSRKAYILLQNKNYRDAEHSASKAREYDSTLPSAPFYLARALQAQQKYDAAVQQYAVAVKLQNTYPQAYYYWGECLLMMGNKQEGKKLLELAQKQNPQLSEKVNALLQKY